MTQDTTENSRAPPMRHHGFKSARRVSDTYKMCDCFILSYFKNVLIYRNIHFSKIYPRIVKLQQKFTLFWIFPRTCWILRRYHRLIKTVLTSHERKRQTDTECPKPDGDGHVGSIPQNLVYTFPHNNEKVSF